MAWIIQFIQSDHFISAYQRYNKFTYIYCRFSNEILQLLNCLFRFSCGQMVLEECDMKDTFTGHKVSPERQYAIYEKLFQTYNSCGIRSEPWLLHSIHSALNRNIFPASDKIKYKVLVLLKCHSGQSTIKVNLGLTFLLH